MAKKNPVQWKNYGGKIPTDVWALMNATGFSRTTNRRWVDEGGNSFVFDWNRGMYRYKSISGHVTESGTIASLDRGRISELLNERASMGGRKTISKLPKKQREYIAWLRESLIPDLRESGYDGTADDLEDGIGYMENPRGYKSRNFEDRFHYVEFLEETLIPDLIESDSPATAEDFQTIIKFLEPSLRVWP